MKYRDPQTGEFKDITVKASDTLPIGTIVDYDGDIVPDGWETVDDTGTYKKIKKIATSIGVLGKILNTKSTSQENTYSCDYLNSKFVGSESIKTKTYTNELVANSNVSPFNSWCQQDVSDIKGIIIQVDARNNWNVPLLASKVGSNINVVGNMSTNAGANVYITVTYIEI